MDIYSVFDQMPSAKRPQEQIYTDSERFERLVNCDFSFVKRYGTDRIEEKYAEMIRTQRVQRFKKHTQNREEQREIIVIIGEENKESLVKEESQSSKVGKKLNSTLFD